MNKKFIYIIFTLVISFNLNSCDSEAQKEIDDRNAYLEANNITVEPTASGLYYIETKEGIGRVPEYGETVTINYVGKFLNGIIFENSYENGNPIEFVLGAGQVIRGWDEGISYVREGGKATLIIPSILAYGSNGNSTIPPYSTIIFDVELIDIN